MGPYPKLARGNGTLKVSTNPQTMDQMLKAIQHFNPKSGVKAAPRFGRLQGFKPMRIPIVFHCECVGVAVNEEQLRRTILVASSYEDKRVREMKGGECIAELE
jgi:hypothetical protein